MIEIPQPERLSTVTEAQKQYARLLADAGAQSIVRWRLDPGNAGLLSRLLPILASRGVSTVEIEIPAVDNSEVGTDISDEASLVGVLRHLQVRATAALQLRVVLSVGRNYVPPPRALDLSTTNRCGLACAMCGSRFAKPDVDRLQPEEICALIDQAANWGVRSVALTGAGEPFGDPNMPGYLEHAQRRGLRATVTTNGTPLTQTLATRLAPMPLSVSVSIHGASDRVHDHLVGVPGSRARAWSAVRHLVAARQRCGSQGRFTVSVSSVIQRDNLHEVAALVRQSFEEGCDGHNLQPINLQRGALLQGEIVRRDDRDRTQLLWPKPGELAPVDALFDALELWVTAHPGHLRASAERLSALRKHLCDSDRSSLDEPCRAGYTFLGVDHRGEIRPCYRVPWHLGSVRGTTLQAVWNSKAYDRVRARMTRCPLTCMNNCFFRSDRGGQAPW